MTSIDKAAIGWSIAIVAIGVAIAFAGAGGQDLSVGTQAPTAPTTSTTTPSEEPQTQTEPFADIAEKVKEEAPAKPLKAGWDRMESVQDPGVGHEQHQLAIILPPSENVYSGTLRYDASENIQLVTLHGPLATGEDKGQAIWTPDGETKFALTFVDPMNAKGEWQFAGNALAVHTKNPTPFIVDYQVDYEENTMSETVMTGTIQSVQDPGMGHESHQLAVILAPSSDVYSGILSYSTSEPIQLVSLRGPISADEQPELTWTPDGETIFELTFVDPKNAMGSWEFEGNALAVHTMNPTTFTVSYSVSAIATAVEPSPEMVEEPAPVETAPEEPAGPQTVMVDIPAGTAVPGCEETDECYIPASVTINAGDTVTWINLDTAAHTVTGGSPAEGPSGVFDSSLVLGGAEYSFTFEESGSYDYFCMVHPWMVGDVQVN
ncbi:MAG: copper-binding protein [Nitrososphaeria archaeon]|nr:copper-binding protein [Nitrosopumilaceae archaeon]NIP10209.1 copper-binding protein [Nitrosopumilaceae archaeon]NIP91573.1 copper-binding protein [Nitrososphaeria archaeon]NIS95408.1 copper-binding protein [Nitrosopumilaceae archaeon]